MVILVVLVTMVIIVTCTEQIKHTGCITAG